MIPDFHSPPLYHGVGEGVWLTLHTLCTQLSLSDGGYRYTGELALPQGHSYFGGQTLACSQIAVRSALSGHVVSLHFKYKCFALWVTNLFLMCLLWTGPGCCTIRSCAMPLMPKSHVCLMSQGKVSVIEAA